MNSSCKSSLFAILLLAAGTLAPFGQAEVTEDSIAVDTCGAYCRCVKEGNFMDGSFMEGTETCTDTCGTLAGLRLKCIRKATTRIYNHGGGYETEFTIETEAVETQDGNLDTVRTHLVKWGKSERNPFEMPSWSFPDVEGRKHDLRIFEKDAFDRPRLLARFVWRKDRLELAPDFRKQLVSALDKPDTSLHGLDLLRSMLDPGDWNADSAIRQVLELHSIKDSVAWGMVDFALEALGELSKAPADGTISRVVKRLTDSLQAWKKAMQPLSLEGARKIGRLVSEPIYPPLDSPTVFWRDSLLCVVQQDGKAATRMRAWHPRTGSWGKAEKVRYPETGISHLYPIHCPWSLALIYPRKNCWSRKMKEPENLSCPALDCDPLLILGDTIPGSLENPEDLAKAGGSSAAGFGRFVFGNGGLLYRADSAQVGWRVLPDTAPPVFGRGPYGLYSERDYPVVVSPDQDWVAFALRSRDEKSIDLWAGRLRYRE